MRWRYLLLAGTCLVAILTITTTYVATPQAVRIALAVLIVFMVPGFAAVCAVFPVGQLPSGEHVLASLGLSLAIATCTAVLLGATPIGLSPQSFSVALGGSTIALSIVAGFRSFAGFRRRPKRVQGDDEAVPRGASDASGVTEGGPSVASVAIEARRIPQATVAALVLLVVSTVAVVTLVLARGGLSMPPAGEGGLPTPTTDAVASSSPDALPTSTAVASPSSAGASLAPAPRVTSSAIGDHYALLELCPDRPACYIYVVRAGDNLLSIANYFGVIYATILELNPSIRDPALIKKGQRIILPPPTR